MLGRDHVNDNNLSLNNLIKELCLACRQGVGFNGDIGLMFGQGGLRSVMIVQGDGLRLPIVLSSEAKIRLVPLLKAICEPLFIMKPPANGLVTLHIQGGKLSGLPDCKPEAGKEQRLYGEEYNERRLRYTTLWTALKKHSEAPIMNVLDDPHRYYPQSAKTHQVIGRDGETISYIKVLPI
jgi:hypothetical protein